MPIENVRICWECYAFLKKATKFRIQVLTANKIIQSDERHNCGSLSCLGVDVRNNVLHPTFTTETSICIKEENVALIKKYSDSDHTQIENESEESESPIVLISNKIKECIANSCRQSSNWAMKRSRLNRKPKFKRVDGKNVKIDNFFRKNIIGSFKRCLICSLDAKSETGLMLHYNRVHDKKLVCDVCNVKFYDGFKFDSHVKTHVWIYECIFCKFLCYNAIMRRKHLMKSHPHIYYCVQCAAKFQSRRSFFQHYKECHERYICDYCGISFKMKYCIKNHIRKQHSPIECKPCNKRFARYNGLWLHNKTRHGPPTATAYCVECDKSFPDVYRYKWHLANSAKHKPRKKVSIPCTQCDKVFSKKIYMKDHYNMVHLKQFKYRCEDCDKNYIRNADLVKHKRRVHEGILPPKNKICNMCGRGFSTNKILNNHLRTHTGERPFACTACPARFVQRTALVGHMRALHHTEEQNKKPKLSHGDYST